MSSPTRIGVLSDSHGRAGMTASAVEHLQLAGASMMIHLGDFVSESVLDELVGHNAHVVFGNCDWNVQALSSYAESLDIAVHHPLGWLEVDGKHIAFTHGHLLDKIQEALTRNADIILHGHTHEVRDEMMNGTRFLNPGALFRASRYTVGILTPESGHFEIIELPKPTAC